MLHLLEGPVFGSTTLKRLKEGEEEKEKAQCPAGIELKTRENDYEACALPLCCHHGQESKYEL